MARNLSNSGEAAALRGQSPSPSPRSASTSLQAAAAVNAGLQQEDQIARRTYDAVPCRKSARMERLPNTHLHSFIELDWVTGRNSRTLSTSADYRRQLFR
jgi:hypothetical protein